jgi:hypothetical protein
MTRIVFFRNLDVLVRQLAAVVVPDQAQRACLHDERRDERVAPAEQRVPDAHAAQARATATNGGVRSNASSSRRAAALFSSGARFAVRRHARSSARAAGPETPSAKAKASSRTPSPLSSPKSSIRPSYGFRFSVFVARDGFRGDERVSSAFRSDPNPPGAPRVNRRNAARVTTSADVTSRAVVVAAFVD